MTNVELLKKEMRIKDISISDLAKFLDVDKSTIYRKLKANTLDEFTIGETNKIVELLGISTEMAVEIFFTHPVA